MAALHIGIAGAGLLGRLLAWRLARLGHGVSVFDPAPGPEPGFDGQGAAAASAAGMLSPLAELDCAEPEIADLGWRSIDLWRGIVASLEEPRPRFHARGSLLVAHRGDLPAAQRVLARIGAAGHAPADPGRSPQPLSGEELARLEPALHGPSHAWLLPGEGQIDPLAMLQALHREAPAVAWHWGCRVTGIARGVLRVEGPAGDGRHAFDSVFDARGLGARPDWPLRGVRGETVWLHASGHGLTRPVRVLHPRHRVYLVPRPGDMVLVGASEIESEDRSPVSLRSAVELMTAAHSVMPALAEARILRLDRNLRPALPDNRPRIEVEPRCVRINGLFRHGWLLAPALVEDALAAWGRVAVAGPGDPASKVRSVLRADDHAEELRRQHASAWRTPARPADLVCTLDAESAADPERGA